VHSALAAIAPPTVPATPPVLFLRTGFVPADAPHFVQFVDEDASGNLRLVEEAPESPASAPRPCLERGR
jgi:hypothetical protein